MRILVTGANGQLGQTVLEQLNEGGKHDIIASARTKSVLETPPWEHIGLNISNAEQIHYALEYYKPDAVLNCAAMTHVDNCEKNPDLSYLMNAEATSYLAKECARKGVYLCHVSTDFVFDGEGEGWYTEDHEPRPVNVYGKHKLKGEKLIRQTPDLNYSILRTIVVYGVSPYVATNNMILWAKAALEKGESIKVITDQHRSITYVEDLARACIGAMEKRVSGTYHISGGERASVYEWIDRMAKHWNISTESMAETTSAALNQPALRPPKTGFILDKATRDLNYSPTPFEKSLDQMAEKLKNSLA